MLQKIYLDLLISCGFSSPGVLGTFLGNNQGNSTNLHCRKKRMLEHNADAVFITKIVLGYQVICTGTIVSPRYVLATGRCHIDHLRERYFVASGLRHFGNMQVHSIRHIWRGDGDLLLFQLYEPIDFMNPSVNRPMPFYENNVRPDLPHLNHYAWDPYNQVQIKKHVRIVNRAGNPSLGNDQIVTGQMHGNRRATSHTMNIGSPLAVGHHLVGILVTQGATRDTFTLVHHGTEHYTWIMGHIHGDLQNLVDSLNQGDQK